MDDYQQGEMFTARDLGFGVNSRPQIPLRKATRLRLEAQSADGPEVHPPELVEAEPATDDPLYDDVLVQARCVSAGTLATLTGHTRYVVLDEIHAEFVGFVRDRENWTSGDGSWQPLWVRFWEQNHSRWPVIEEGNGDG